MQLSFKPYFATGSLLFTVGLTFWGCMMFMLAQVGFIRQLLLKVRLQGEGLRYDGRGLDVVGGSEGEGRTER